jgi:hypothetical protein
MRGVRRARWIGGLLLTSALLSGCSVGPLGDATAYQPSIGSSARTEQVDALGVAIVVDSDRNGRVVGTLLNTEDRRHALTGASVKSDGVPRRSALLADVVLLPPGEPVHLAHEAPVSVPADQLSVGSFVELTLRVTDGELVQMLVPVEAKRGPYADVEVVGVP